MKRRPYKCVYSEEDEIDYLKKLFNKHVIKQQGCWDWNGSKSLGYGVTFYKKKNIRAHRASWLIHYGIIPEEMFVCHECDNPSCSNPEHLFLGTAKDNVIDMYKKGRNPLIKKFEEEKVRTIKTFFHPSTISNERLAKMFNVSINTIRYLKYGKTWKHIPNIPEGY